jgi:hypothetical protein
MPTKTAWANAVIVHLNQLDEKLFKAATSANHDELGKPPPKDPVDFLSWLRGDEPWASMEFEEMNPQDYAQILIEEWRLYGPGGE